MSVGKYPDLERFAQSMKMPPENLVKAFEIEKEFHTKILAEPDRRKRRDMYQEVYNVVHPLYACYESPAPGNPKDYQIRQFRRELSGKSVLDLGCGNGNLLLSIANNLPHGRLLGIDASVPRLPKEQSQVEFHLGDIVEFETDETFDVVFSDVVIEHIAPADLPIHLASVRKALRPGGKFIVVTCNRLFGPTDVTRIIDFHNVNRVPAMGTHLCEMSFTELQDLLKANGFGRFRTVASPIVRLFWPSRRPHTWLRQRLENSTLMLKLFYRFPKLSLYMGFQTVAIISEPCP